MLLTSSRYGVLFGAPNQKSEESIHLLSWDKVVKPKREMGLGVRSMRHTNSASLAKLGWRVLHEPESVWSRLLRGKYCNGRLDIYMLCKRSYSSSVWRGVVRGAQTLSKGLRKAVGNGCSTLFWIRPWLLDTPLMDTALQPIPDLLLGSTVAEVWMGSTWDWNLISAFLPAHIQQKLMAIRILDQVDAVDRPFWGPSPSRIFTTSSAMRIQQPASHLHNDLHWAKIWSLPVQQCVRHESHLVAHDSLLCNANRVRRTLSSDSSYPRCNKEENLLQSPGRMEFDLCLDATVYLEAEEQVSFCWCVDDVGKLSFILSSTTNAYRAALLRTKAATPLVSSRPCHVKTAKDSSSMECAARRVD